MLTIRSFRGRTLMLAGAMTACLAGGAGGALPAPAASAAASGATYSTVDSGYGLSGASFRFAQAQAALPTDQVCARLHRVVHSRVVSGFEISASTGWASAVVGTVPHRSGCGPYFAELSRADLGSSPIAIQLAPGDQVTFSAYYDQDQRTVTATVTDLATGASASITKPYTGPAPAHAGVFAAPYPFVTAPASSFPAVAFTHAAATTLAGTRGTLTGPWTTSEEIMTSNGKPGGTLEASTQGLSGGGRSFTVWIRAAR